MSPGSYPRPSLSDVHLAEALPHARGVAGELSSAFVERCTDSKSSTPIRRVAGELSSAFVERPAPMRSTSTCDRVAGELSSAFVERASEPPSGASMTLCRRGVILGLR